jgi:hypothetical protein
MRENRRTTRRRVREWGKIVFNEGRSVLNCTVVDISATGARLIVGTDDLPRTFFLYRKFDASLREARIVRWAFQTVGVRLAEPLDLASEKAKNLLAVLRRHPV